MTDGGAWVHLREIKGGLLVTCGLCGKEVKRSFYNDATNYAEARRLATAYHWKHEHSDAHQAAVAAFHSDPPPPTEHDQVMEKVFGASSRTERDRRKDAARLAARNVRRGEA